jgi:hypothetical protein
VIPNLSSALEPPLCNEKSEAYEICQSYRMCIMMGQFMGEYTSRYLKETCTNRAKSEYDLTDDEFEAALEDATPSCEKVPNLVEI